MKKIFFNIGVVAAMSFYLAACGGGGTSNTASTSQGNNGVNGSGQVVGQVAPNVPSDAQGIYVGTVNGGATSQLSAILLEDGVFYYGVGLNGNVTVAVAGNATGNNGSASSTNALNYDSFNKKVTPISAVSTSYTPKKSISGTETDSSGASASFTGNYLASYETPASLQNMSGSFAGKSASATGYVPATINFATDGTISGTTVGASGGSCVFTGNAVPRASGKNIVNITVNFGQGCVDAGKSATGIATTAFSSGTTVTLHAIASLADRSNVFYAVAVKQ